MRESRPYSRIIKSLKDIRNNKWNYLDFTYFRKWILIGFVLGIVAGLGAIALYLGVAFFTSLFLVSGTGYIPPLPGSFHAESSYELVIGKTVDDSCYYRAGRSTSGDNYNQILSRI